MWGFTKQESRSLLFLIFSFSVGLGIWIFRSWIEPLPEITEEVQETKVILSGDTADTKKARGMVSINKGDWEELDTVPGIGPVIAKRIVEYRLQNGPFQSCQDLAKVKGIGPKTLEKIKMFITL